MMKKIKKIWKRYLGILIMLVLIILGMLSFYGDVAGNAADMEEENLTDDAAIYTNYVDEMLKARLARLEDMAKAMNQTVQSDLGKARQILKENRMGFDGLLVLNLEGKRELGDEILFNLIQDEMMEPMVNDRRSLVYKTLVKDAELNRYVVMCAPIQERGRVVAILAGAIRMEGITEMMGKWNDSQSGCAFLISEQGEYLSEGKEFEEMIGGEANNFFTYLSNCKMRKKSPSRDAVERYMKKRHAAAFRYTYNRDDYICNIQPCVYGGWYAGYLKLEKSVYRHAFALSRGTIIISIISIGFWFVLMAFFGISIYHNEAFREQQERQDILNDLEKAIIFEFNFFPKELCFYGDGEQMFGHELRALYGEEVYEVYDFIHPDDASVRGRIHQFYDDDASMFAAEVRIKNNNGYGWYRIIGKLVKDKRFGSNLKFIGKVENADQEIAEEKNLVERAENDLLTGVLNKKTMEEKVTQCLASIKDNNHCIFFMVDLDNFKNVNDKLGHISGDKAIVDTADRLREVFPKKAYVGRLGGDEFAVCAIYDAFDEESMHEYVKRKAEKICEVNRRTYRNGETEVSISSSVGIALAPDQATQFEDLYKKADSALYQSKNGGKNCYHLYQ